MDNPETLATVGTSGTKRKTNKKQTNITTQKTKKMSNTDTRIHEGQAITEN